MQRAIEAASQEGDPSEPARARKLQARYERARRLRRSELAEDKRRARSCLRRAADGGHVEAAFLLGWWFETEPDWKDRAAQAVRYYTLAAQRGHARACSNLGLCYERGDAGAVNLELALDWYRKGAELGGKEAWFHLGRCYADGVLEQVDERRALAAFRKSAKLGYASAHFRLGGSYDERAQREPDERKRSRLERVAAAHYELGAGGGDASSQYNLAICYFRGSGVPADPERAVAWLQRAAERGDADAQYRLARALSEGEGVAQSHVRAFEWLQRAAAQAEPRALTALGWAYREGQGTEPDPAAAVRYFREAAELGHAAAECALGGSLATGNGAARDDAEAVVWLRRAAEHGDEQADAYLGLFYLDARGGLRKDEAEGFRRVKAGAEQALPWAEARLGWCYWDGVGVERDPDVARAWLAAATLHGIAAVAVELAGRPGTAPHDIQLARSWLVEAARQGDRDARFWKNRLWRVTTPYLSWASVTLTACGYSALLYHLLTAPFRFPWLGTVALIAVVSLVALVTVTGFTVGTSRRQADALLALPDSADFRMPWRVLLRVPAEDGVFLLPLLYVGVTPLAAAVSGSLFALVHVPTYPFWAAVPKGISYFLVGLFLLPEVGVWPIIVGHVLLDAVAIALRRARDA